jgi:hypothetical protein
VKRQEQETTEEYLTRADDFLGKLRMALATIVACQVHLEKCAKIIGDEYPEIDTEKEWAEVFENLCAIGNKTTRYAEEVMEVK